MMTTNTYFLYLLLISNAVLLTIACLAVVRFERRCRRIEKTWTPPADAATGELDNAAQQNQVDTTQQIQQQLAELQRAVKIMDLKVPDQPSPVERTLPIENAVRMARSGASIDELKRSCGLNNGEASLMQKLHGTSRIMAAAPYPE